MPKISPHKKCTQQKRKQYPDPLDGTYGQTPCDKNRGRPIRPSDDSDILWECWSACKKCRQNGWKQHFAQNLQEGNCTKQNPRDQKEPIQRRPLGKQLTGKILVELRGYSVRSPHIFYNLLLRFTRLHTRCKIAQQIVFDPFLILRGSRKFRITARI